MLHASQADREDFAPMVGVASREERDVKDANLIGLNLTVLPCGALLMTANNSTRNYLATMGDDTDFNQAMYDLLEPFSTNGGFTLFDAGAGNPFVGLTSAPCIAESMDYLDDGAMEVNGRLWWFESYQVRSYVQELRTKGRVIFDAACELATV